MPRVYSNACYLFWSFYYGFSIVRRTRGETNSDSLYYSAKRVLEVVIVVCTYNSNSVFCYGAYPDATNQINAIPP